MKAFIDRNYFIYRHGQKYAAKAVGLIVVGEQIGLDDTLHTLRQFADEFGVGEDGIFTVSGYARKVGDAGKNPRLAEEARELGRRMVQFLKG